MPGRHAARLALLLLALAVVPAAPAGAVESAEPEVIAGALQEIEKGDTIDLSTVGRRTGRVHTRTVWYVVDKGRILVQSGKDGRTDWYRNLRKNPNVTVRGGGYAFRGTATPVTDPAEAERIRRLFLDKYTTAWILSWLGSGIGQGLPVEIKPETVAGAGSA